MKTTFQIRGIRYDIDDPIDISIPLRFNGPQPNAFGVKPAASEPVRAGEIVGDTRLGGSVNFEQYTLIPHCNGTHTECVGHITHERISVRECLKDVFINAVLISVAPEWIGGSDDLVITRGSIDAAIRSTTGDAETAAAALIVRALPNNDSKMTREYGDDAVPPYFLADAMRYIVEIGFKHLLVDLPSIDRLFDEGKLVNHRTFWNVDAGSFETNENTRRDSTITELIYVSNVVEDGRYLLNLQIAPFGGDASPSRPILFRMTESE